MDTDLFLTIGIVLLVADDPVAAVSLGRRPGPPRWAPIMR